jgi:hypothetical protein
MFETKVDAERDLKVPGQMTELEMGDGVLVAVEEEGSEVVLDAVLCQY